MKERNYLDLLGKAVPGDIVSIKFGNGATLKHYGIVAENILYVYDFSVFNGKDFTKEIVRNNVEDSTERIIVQKRTWKQFRGNLAEFPKIEKDYSYNDDQRIITLIRAAILTKIFKEKIFKENILRTRINNSILSKLSKIVFSHWLIKHIAQLVYFDSSEYNLWYSNCEHVARGCRTGIWKSKQVHAISSLWKWGLPAIPIHRKTLFEFLPRKDVDQTNFTEYPDSCIKIYGLIIYHFLKFTFYFRIKSIFIRPDILKITDIPQSLCRPYDDLCKDYLRKNRLIVLALFLLILIIFNIDKLNNIVAPTLTTSYPVKQNPLDDNKKYYKYYVKENDTLMNIAKNCYGNEKKWLVIYNTNKSLIGNDPDKIKQGILLRIPVDYNNRSHFRTQDCST